MNPVAVLAYVHSAVVGISGITAVQDGLPQGWPANADAAASAYILLDVGGAQSTSYLTQSAAGTWEIIYPVYVHIVVGGKMMTHQDALAAILPLRDRIRAALASDFTLGGLVVDTDLSGPASNITGAAYAALDAPPEDIWTLLVKEHSAANASSAT